MPRDSAPYETQEPPQQPDMFDWAERIRAQFGRFTWDFSGVLLIAFSLMTFLALTGLTGGLVLVAWSAVLRLWLGWGGYLVVIVTAFIGLMLLRKNNRPLRLSLGRIVALELAPFLTLTFLAILGPGFASLLGSSSTALERAENGLDGGRIGWGLARFIQLFTGDVLRDILVVLALIITVMAGFGLFPRLEAWILKMAGMGAAQEAAFNPKAAVQAPADSEPVIHPVAEKSVEKPRKPAAAALPPEFRKSFKVEDNQKDEKPAKPRERGENLPSLNILFTEQASKPDERTINQTAGLIEKTLSEFGIPAQVVGFRVGPSVTQFAVQPGFIKKSGTNEEDAQLMKVRVAQIASLQRDLALALSAERLRIEAPVPGRSYVGIEVPNAHTSTVRLRPILETEAFHKITSPLALALGRDVSGQPVVADLARMPHLLIAGATGSGKSVCVTALAACLAMNNSPDELRLVMIDAKMVELIRFNGLPHLLGKVETNMERIMGVLRWVVVEMEHRYRLLESSHSRDIEAYNRKMNARKDGQPLPRIVVFVDELADLMMNGPDQTEHNLVRLAQMARATGIHLVVATQRPSTDVVTGLIKANFPARLAFSVASGVDSRVILDMPGAETLLGRGDMLFQNPEVGNPQRAQGVFVTDQEIERIIAFWQKVAPTKTEAPPWETLLIEPDENSDDGLVQQAAEIVRQSQRASASLLQRRLRIGYPRAARLLDQLEELGIVGPSQGGGRERDVLVPPEDGDEQLMDNDAE
jgi:DNA segregation ATPase FtsK/SpoIIIE, S-DNA-T family